MKHPIISNSIAFIAFVALIALAYALVGCASTPAQQASRQQILTEFNAFAQQAKPIVNATLAVIAKKQGISPEETAAALKASEELYGMASAAWAGQPVSQGTTLTDVAAAVLPLLPKNSTSADIASILTSAAAQASPATTP